MISHYSNYTLPGSFNWISMCYSKDLRMFVMVSTDKIIVSEDDGATWKDVITPPTQPTTYYKVCYSDYLHMFLLIGNSKNTAYSYDGYTWETSTSTATLPMPTVNVICWSEELRIFCATGNLLGGKAMISRDGNSWTERSLPISKSWRSICWSSKHHKFVLVSQKSNIVLTSTNGIEWKIVTLPEQLDYTSIAYNNSADTFCIVGTNTDKVVTSSDGGITWTTSTLPRSMNLTSIIYAPNLNRFLCTENNSDKLIVSTGSNGWVEKSLGSQQHWNLVGYSSYSDVIVCASRNYNQCMVSKTASDMNFTWNMVYTFPRFSQMLYGMVYIEDDNAYYTYKYNTRDYYKSTDGGASWTSLTAANACFPFTNMIYNKKYNILLAPQNDSSHPYLCITNLPVMTTDTYNTTNVAPYSFCKDVSYSEELDMFCMVGDGNQIAVSNKGDHTHWSYYTLATNGKCACVCTSSGKYKFCAIRHNNDKCVALLSTNGKDWIESPITVSDPSTVTYIKSMCYCEKLGIFCAFTTCSTAGNQYFKSLISPDGINWQEYLINNEYHYLYNRVMWIKDYQLLCTMSHTGTMFTSADGIHWKQYKMSNDAGYSYIYGWDYDTVNKCFLTISCRYNGDDKVKTVWRSSLE